MHTHLIAACAADPVRVVKRAAVILGCRLIAYDAFIFCGFVGVAAHQFVRQTRAFAQRKVFEC